MRNINMVITVIALAIAIGAAIIVEGGCSFIGQEGTKKFGGTTTIDLPVGKKLVPYTIQWEPDDSNLWYLTEDAEEGYIPKTYEFHESSNMGIMQGSVKFIEH